MEYELLSLKSNWTQPYLIANHQFVFVQYITGVEVHTKGPGMRNTVSKGISSLNYDSVPVYIEEQALLQEGTLSPS